jgi:hypothetical protein
LFPELGRDLTRRNYGVYSLFFDLLPLVRAAFETENEGLARRIFAFAEWCAVQTAKELWNPAGLAFYEHLFDQPAYSEQVIPLLSPRVVYTHWGPWEARVSTKEWARGAVWLEPKRAAGEREFRLTRRRG